MVIDTFSFSEVTMVQKGKKGKGKKVAAAPLAVKKVSEKRVVNPLFQKTPKNFGIGQVIGLKYLHLIEP